MRADKEVWKWKQKLGRLKTKIQGMVISKSQTKQRNIFPWGLRGLPAQPCVHILCICSVHVHLCVHVWRERKSCDWPSCMCRGQRTTSRVSPCLPETLVTLDCVSQLAGIGSPMDSLLSIPVSHRSTEIQIDVGVLGIQTSSHIFVASALPT